MRFIGRAVLALILILLTLGLIALAVYQYWQMQANKPKPVQRQARERSWQVETIRVSKQDLPVSVSAFGNIVAGKALKIRSEVAGKVIAVSPGFKTGQFVKAGSVLFSVDPFVLKTEVDQAQLNLRNAGEQISELRLQIANEETNRAEGAANLAEAEDSLVRTEKLADRGFVSKAAVQRAETALAAARRVDRAAGRTISVLKNRISQLEIARDRAQSALDRSRRNLDTTAFTAPFAGLIDHANLEPGQQISTAEQVGTLIDPTALEVSFRIPDREAGKLFGVKDDVKTLLGRKVDLTWSLGEKQLAYTGAVSRISANVNSADGGLQMFATIDNLPVTTPLRAGAFVTVRLDAGLERGIYSVPQSAVSPGGQVYLVDDDSRVAPVKIEMVRREGDTVLLRGDIPRDKDMIVNRFPQISKGVKVKIASKDGVAVETGPATVKLSEARRQEIIATIQAGAMPEFVKKRLIRNFSTEEVPRTVLERMRERSGMEFPELDTTGGTPATGQKPKTVNTATGANSGNGTNSNANTGTGTGTVKLSVESANKLKEAVENSPMPDTRKGRIIAQILSGEMPRNRLENIAGRMNLDIPELKNAPEPEPQTKPEPEAKTGQPKTGQSKTGQSATLPLSDARRAAITAKIKASPAPDFVKERILKDFETPRVPRKTLEQLRDRMGLEIPELK